jgi:hypothetical protein
MARETELRNKVALKDVGNPKTILGQAETVKELKLGSIIGIAKGRKIVRGMERDGVTPTEHHALAGDFQAIPTDETKAMVRSGVAYLTDGMMEPIFRALEGETNPETGEVTGGAGSVAFAYDVYAIRSTNAAGYSWALRPKVQAEAVVVDPLASLRDAVLAAPEAVAAIADGTKADKK